MPFTNEEKAKEAKREGGYRRYVYLRLVEAGKIKQKESDRRIAIMDEIQNDYEVKAAADRRQETLPL